MPRPKKLPPLLVVDDTPEDVVLLQRAIDKAGVTNPVVVIEDGEESIAYLRKACEPGGTKPAAVFLDVKMPRVDGFEVLQWIRQEKALLETKVIIVSGLDEPKEIQRATRLGADAYLLKHPNPHTLAFLMRSASRKAPASHPRRSPDTTRRRKRPQRRATSDAD